MNFWDRDSYDNQNNTYSGCVGKSEAEVRDRIDEYLGKSEDQLMSELSATVARMKKEGSFDPAALENLYNTASPFLNDEQRRRMRSIIEMFKG